MAFHTYKVELYGKNSNGSYVTTPTLLDDIVSIDVSIKEGENADGFSITLNNVDELFETIKIDDRVKIYGSLNGTTFTQLLDGIVNEKTQNEDASSRLFTITGLNRLEKLFNALVSTTGENIQHTASYWVKNIIQQVNEFNNLGSTDRTIYYNDTTVVATTGDISFVKGFERAFKLIEELAQPENTGGINYIYYLDENNYFHFEPRPNDTQSSSLEFGNQIISHRTRKGVYDIVNYIIMNAGKSPYGMSILQMDYKSESISQFGWKVKLINEGISSSLGTKEIRLMRQRNVYAADSLFPTAYPFVTSWGVSTDSDSSYNSAYVDEVLRLAKIKINEILNKSIGATYKLQLQIEPSFSYALYQKYNIIIPNNSYSIYYNWLTGVVLRIISLDYNFSEKGWVLDITFDQDEEDVVV